MDSMVLIYIEKMISAIPENGTVRVERLCHVFGNRYMISRSIRIGQKFVPEITDAGEICFLRYGTP